MKESKYVIVRAYQAGCFAGHFISREGSEVHLKDARRLWAWKGAASLSQMAVDGVSCPNECKFPVAVPFIEILGVIEVITTTEKAEASIKAVPIWAY